MPKQWTGQRGLLLHEPWVPPGIRDGLVALISELEAARPPGLGDRRTAFRQQGQPAGGSVKARVLSPVQRHEMGMVQLLDQRAELLVGVRLVRAGVLVRMGRETPDFECQWRGAGFGVEVTTRARPEAGAAVHELLEKACGTGRRSALR